MDETEFAMEQLRILFFDTEDRFMEDKISKLKRSGSFRRGEASNYMLKKFFFNTLGDFLECQKCGYEVLITPKSRIPKYRKTCPNCKKVQRVAIKLNCKFCKSEFYERADKDITMAGLKKLYKKDMAAWKKVERTLFTCSDCKTNGRPARILLGDLGNVCG